MNTSRLKDKNRDEIQDLLNEEHRQYGDIVQVSLHNYDQLMLYTNIFIHNQYICKLCTVLCGGCVEFRIFNKKYYLENIRKYFGIIFF